MLMFERLNISWILIFSVVFILQLNIQIIVFFQFFQVVYTLMFQLLAFKEKE